MRMAMATCPACGSNTGFIRRGADARDGLWCADCPGGSIPRERAAAWALELLRPDWRWCRIHECSPSPRGISRILATECRHYVPSIWKEGLPGGSSVFGMRNEDLHEQSFPDDTFDVVIALDVLEHLERPRDAVREFHRTLRPGGLLLATVPIRPDTEEAAVARVTRDPDGTLLHLMEPEYHGDPHSVDGALVTYDYGYGIHEAIAEWAPFEVMVSRFAIPSIGVVGRHTDVIACWADGAPPGGRTRPPALVRRMLDRFAGWRRSSSR